MRIFTLYRYDYVATHTLGILVTGTTYICDILELPWKENEINVSCIPEGGYIIQASSTPHFEECIVVKDVPGRKAILMHAANQVHELRGCIAPGVKSVEIMLHSRDNLAKILDILGTHEGILEIKRI